MAKKTGAVLNKPVKIPLGSRTNIIAPKGTPVEIIDWSGNSSNLGVKIILKVGRFPLVYEGPLNVALMDISWDIIEQILREEDNA